MRGQTRSLRTVEEEVGEAGRRAAVDVGGGDAVGARTVVQLCRRKISPPFTSQLTQVNGLKSIHNQDTHETLSLRLTPESKGEKIYYG